MMERFLRNSLLLVPAPEMERVSKDDITEDVVRAVVGNVNGGIKLKVARQIASEPESRGIPRAALEIDLNAPGFVEIVGVAEDYFIAVIDVSCADDELVVLGVIAGLNIRLRIDTAVRRPIDEADREEKRFLLNQANFRSENQFVRLKAFENGDFRPFGQA